MRFGPLAKIEGKPVWKLVAEMSPAELVRCIDFRYLTDCITPEWAIEFLTNQVCVNAIVVAEVMTLLYRRFLDTLPDSDFALDEIVRRIPLGQRMATAREISDTCAFLLSSRANQHDGPVALPGWRLHPSR